MDKTTEFKRQSHFLFGHIPGNVRTIVTTLILGLAAGLAAVAFLFTTNLIFSKTIVALASRPFLEFAIGTLIVILASSFIVGVILKYYPEAAGSGIPQLKAAYWKELGYVPWRSVFAKFAAGVISLGGGTSLGREGPTVFLSGGLASALSGFFGHSKRVRRGPASVGAAAGLAAAFNTPLAAITFILEELVGDLNNRYLGSVVLAAVTGALTVHAIIGKQPAFELPEVSGVTWYHYLLVPVVAVLATWAGILFDRYSLRIRGRLKRQTALPFWILPLFGGLLTWAIGVSIFLATGKAGIFGLGYRDLSEALTGGMVWHAAGLLMAGKIASTVFSYGFGGSGGIFSPALFIGGMSGFFIAGIADRWMPLSGADSVVLATVGMSACLGALIRAPLTSILIVFEMTHEFSLVPGLMIGTLLSQALVRLSGRHNFYDSLLLQDGHELIKIKPPRDLHAWQSVSIGQIMNRKPVLIEGFDRASVQRLLQTHPYHCFPVTGPEGVTGIATRPMLQKFLNDGRIPDLEKAIHCHDDQTVREASKKFIESPSGFMVVLNRETGVPSGIVTLHDLLRIQASFLD
ncbi:chloride channel protein [bacterium]|nr:chloride channel protein [bacterium]